MFHKMKGNRKAPNEEMLARALYFILGLFGILKAIGKCVNKK